MKQKKENKIKKSVKGGLTKIILDSFQSNQNHMDGKFTELKMEFKEDIKKVENRLEKVENKLEKVETKLDVFVETYDKEKLPMRVDYIENTLNISKK